MNTLSLQFNEDVVWSYYTVKMKLQSDSKNLHSLFNYVLLHIINKNFLIIKFFVFSWILNEWIKVHGAPFER